MMSDSEVPGSGQSSLASEAQIVAAIRDLRPAKEISYKDFADRLQPLMKAIGELGVIMSDVELSAVDLIYNSWYSDAFAALCTEEALKYAVVTPESFDRACKCFGVFSNLKRFVGSLFDLLNEFRLLLPSFYGFVSDCNTKALLFEEKLWLLRFNGEKFVLTVATQGDNGLECQDHEISYKDEKYFLDGEELPKLKNLLDKYDQDDACTGSPYMGASYMASRVNYDVYELGDEIPFRDVWSNQISNEIYVNSFNIRLYKWLSIYNPNSKLPECAKRQLNEYVRMGANSSGIIRALRLFSREFTLPNDLLWSALGRYNEGVDEIVDYLYSQGADPNLRGETGKQAILVFAHQPRAVKLLLKHPHIDVNVRDEYDTTAVMKATERPEALEMFLNDTRTDVSVRSGQRTLFDCLLYRSPEIDIIQKVIDRGHEIPKLDNRYMVEILKRGETTEYKVQAWQIFIAAGTSIDAVNQEFHTTLHVAAKEATVEDVAALLDLGASIEGSKSCSESPLHAAAARGEAAITELLLARGADAERVNKDGKKAADLAMFGARRLLRNVAPPLGDFTFFGHRIEFDESIPARYSAELRVIGDHYYVQGGYYTKEFHHDDDDSYWGGGPFWDLWRAPVGSTLINDKELIKWENVKIPSGIDFHTYQPVRTVQVDDEIWYIGFDDKWVKFSTKEGEWDKQDPCESRKNFVNHLTVQQGHDIGDQIVYPSANVLQRISKQNGEVTEDLCEGEEIPEFLHGWSNDQILIGNNIWLKMPKEDHSFIMLCLDLTNRTWYRVGDVDEEISGTLVACGNYILSTGWNDDTNDFKICVFDTQSLNWTKHKLEINSGTFVPGEKQSMCVHKHRLILFGAQTSNQSQTNAMYSVDLSPLLGVKSLAMISALAVVANPDKVAAKDVENLPEDLKTRMGFSNKKE